MQKENRSGDVWAVSNSADDFESSAELETSHAIIHSSSADDFEWSAEFKKTTNYLL